MAIASAQASWISVHAADVSAEAKAAVEMVSGPPQSSAVVSLEEQSCTHGNPPSGGGLLSSVQ